MCMVFIFQGLLQSLTPNCTASSLTGSKAKRGKHGLHGGKERIPSPGGWIVLYWPVQLHLFKQGVATLQNEGREGQTPNLPLWGRKIRTPSVTCSPARRVRSGSQHRSCSGGNFLSLQLSEASPCPLLVSILSVAHGLGAPVRGPAISHRLASLLP